MKLVFIHGPLPRAMAVRGCATGTWYKPLITGDAAGAAFDESLPRQNSSETFMVLAFFGRFIRLATFG